MFRPRERALKKFKCPRPQCVKNVELLKHSKISKNSTFLTLCASVGNKKVFNIIDARCNHEVKYECIFTYIYYFNLCTMHLVQFIIQTKNAQYIYIYIYISINNILYTYRKRSYMFH